MAQWLDLDVLLPSILRLIEALSRSNFGNSLQTICLGDPCRVFAYCCAGRRSNPNPREEEWRMKDGDEEWGRWGGDAGRRGAGNATISGR